MLLEQQNFFVLFLFFSNTQTTKTTQK